MARAPRTTKATETKAVTNYEDQLAKMAAESAEAEKNAGGGSFFSLQSGQLSFDGAPIPGNKMIGIIVDSIFENVYYEGKYDPQNPAPPVCYALGRSEDTMAPGDDVRVLEQAQSDACADCPMNKWGSADTGKGKACRNVRRLAIIPGGTYNVKTDEMELFSEESDLDGQIGIMKLPVMSVKGYANYVKQLAGALKRPPLGVYTQISVVPDPKSQFRVQFEAIDPIPGNLIGKVMQRNEEAKLIINSPYQLEKSEEEPTPPPARGRGRQGAAGKGRGRF